MVERVEVQCDDCDAEVWHDLHEWDNEVQEDNMDEQYIKLLRDLLNSIQDSINAGQATSGELENAIDEISNIEGQIQEAMSQAEEARFQNDNLINELEELYADVESEIIKEQNNAINAG